MGSSMMPGKVNPVIPEFLISISHKVYANDQMISALAASGCLDLNAYLPSIGLAFIESFNLLCSGCKSMAENLLKGMTVSTKNEQDDLFKNPSITTALVPYIGHEKAALLARNMKESNTTVFESNAKLAILPEEKIQRILQPSALTAKGFSLKDIDPVETDHSD
jgi:aspartate ammonia-lyase